MPEWLSGLVHFVTEWAGFIFHVDRHLEQAIQTMGAWTYALLGAVVFAETGLVVTPLLPGDSLLFAAGALAAQGHFSLVALWGLLWFACVAGDNLNYAIGRFAGLHAFGRWMNPKHLERTKVFYLKHGGKTLIMARFAPIVRTFAPFVAGVGKMPYPRFLAFSVAGGFLWITTCLGAGFAFGNIPVVKKHFELVVLGIVAVSLLPMVIETYKAWRGGDKAPGVDVATL